MCQKFNASDVPSWNYLKRGLDWPANTAWTCAPEVPCMMLDAALANGQHGRKGTASTYAVLLMLVSRCGGSKQSPVDFFPATGAAACAPPGTILAFTTISAGLSGRACVRTDTRYVAVPASQSVRLGSPAVTSAAVLVSLQLRS